MKALSDESRYLWRLMNESLDLLEDLGFMVVHAKTNGADYERTRTRAYVRYSRRFAAWERCVDSERMTP